MEAIGLVFMILPIGFFTLMIYAINRSRCSLEEAAQLSGCSQQDLRELIQTGVLDYRRKYLVIGPRSLNASEIEPAREIQRIRADTDAQIYRMAEESAAQIQESNQQHQEKMHRIRADADAQIRRMAEESAAQIQESNQQHQEEMRAQQEEMRARQEELEYMRKVYQEIRESLLAGRAYLPPQIVEAFSVLGLAHDTSLEDIQQCYRQLSKRYHPDAGGTSEQFIRLNTAYQTIRTWLESKGNRNA